jgi:muramoyltetrapeptide carboxypeptidase
MYLIMGGRGPTIAMLHQSAARMSDRSFTSARFRMHRLRPGARIQVVAPAGPFDQDEFERGVERLRARYDVFYEPGIAERAGYFAGSDERRANELLSALRDRYVHAIVAARGGYGATRLLDRIDADLVAKHPKLLVGFSDITALHALWARAGLGSIHGPMVAALGRCNDTQIARWIAAVEGALPPPITGLTALAGGSAQGPLLGGNLAVLSALIGTPYAPPLAGCVLFLEEVGERPYRVDRMLTSWAHAGWLALPRAIVLGGFTDAETGADGTTVEHVLQERLGSLGIPVLTGVPAGHVDDNMELPFGAIAVVDAAQGTLAFAEDATE